MLTPRWTKLNYHKLQSECYRSDARFNINHSGRRSGKTELIGKRKIVKKALKGSQKYNDWRCFVGAPVRHQAKKIYWADLKQLIPKKFLLDKPNESDLIIKLINGSEIHVVGLDRPERIEGIPWNHGLLDEYGNMKEKTWEEHIRPALSDRKGSCDFIGVPEGRNHFFELTQKAKEIERVSQTLGKKSSWRVWHWHSEEIIDQEEIELAKLEMDQLVYEQEFGGEFVNFTGAVYYSFNEKIHVGKYYHLYNKKLPLVLCFDFNVSPGVAVIIQELGSDVFDINKGKTITTVLKEIYIPRNSNTKRICTKIIEDFRDHEGLVICYGDSTGGSKGTAKITGSDWDIIRRMLTPYFGDRLYFNVPTHNPKERQRVNAVNSRLLTMTGEVYMVVDGAYAPYVVKDFEGVRVIEGTAGEIDKDRDPKLTHLSDAIGYYIYREFPVGRYYTREDIRAMMAEHNKSIIDQQTTNRRPNG